MERPQPITFKYQEALVAIELRTPPEQSSIVIAPRTLRESLQRELLPLCYYFMLQHEQGQPKPTIEEAREYSAYVCMDREAFGGDLTTWNPRNLAKEAGVTEEFAQFRINLDLRYQHWKKTNPTSV